MPTPKRKLVETKRDRCPVCDREGAEFYRLVNEKGNRSDWYLERCPHGCRP